jgi:hypothetical protein
MVANLPVVDLADGGLLKLWIESAHQSLTETGRDVIRTFQTKEQFFVVVASYQLSACPGSQSRVISDQLAERATQLLEQGTPLDTVAEVLLSMLPEGEHVPFSILRVLRGTRGELVECDAPPLFMTRGGDLVLLPVVEEESHGHLIRTCEFSLQDGDHLAMVSEGYIHAKGWSRQWGWRDIAISIKRLTGTRCDAEQLLGALVRSYYRLAGEIPDTQYPIPVSIVAMFVRPVRTATVWSGPPVGPPSVSPAVTRGIEEAILEKLMDEPGARIVCGDTTAEIAARLLGAELEMEPRPEDGWLEVPPVSRLRGRPGIERIDLITEGLVTLGKARERIAGAQRVRDLPRKEDGATRLARLLLTADKIHFLVGLAVNPAQTTETGAPLRRIVIEDLMNDLKSRGKLVSVEYF